MKSGNNNHKVERNKHANEELKPFFSPFFKRIFNLSVKNNKEDIFIYYFYTTPYYITHTMYHQNII